MMTSDDHRNSANALGSEPGIPRNRNREDPARGHMQALALGICRGTTGAGSANSRARGAMPGLVCALVSAHEMPTSCASHPTGPTSFPQIPIGLASRTPHLARPREAYSTLRWSRPLVCNPCDDVPLIGPSRSADDGWMMGREEQLGSGCKQEANLPSVAVS